LKKERSHVRVLLVEDESRLAALLRKGLEREGYAVALAGDGPEAVDLGQALDWDVIILDVMLPRFDGYEVARRLRSAAVSTPILMLTARDSNLDIVRGLDCGADDYLTKPFAFDVLLARLRALARRAPAVQPARLRVADLLLDPASREVFRGGATIKLTKTEFGLLEFLMRHPGQVITRKTLIEAVWGFEGDIESNTLDAFIGLLRRKIDRRGSPKLIHTVRGVGYCVREGPLT
jgi:DNA-binding response OmpR family regulator